MSDTGADNKSEYSATSELTLTFNTVFILDIFGVKRARSTVHNWVHKADLRQKRGQSLDHIVVDETVIHINDDEHWLYAAVDPATNKVSHTKLELTTAKIFAHLFLTELPNKKDVDNAVFLIDGSHSLRDACQRHGLDSR